MTPNSRPCRALCRPPSVDFSTTSFASMIQWDPLCLPSISRHRQTSSLFTARPASGDDSGPPECYHAALHSCNFGRLIAFAAYSGKRSTPNCPLWAYHSSQYLRRQAASHSLFLRTTFSALPIAPSQDAQTFSRNRTSIARGGAWTWCHRPLSSLHWRHRSSLAKVKSDQNPIFANLTRRAPRHPRAVLSHTRRYAGCCRSWGRGLPSGSDLKREAQRRCVDDALPRHSRRRWRRHSTSTLHLRRREAQRIGPRAQDGDGADGDAADDAASRNARDSSDAAGPKRCRPRFGRNTLYRLAVAS
jgi:hypothetical protein